MSREFPWYDSWWLTRYVRAKEFIALRYPASLNAFTQAFRPLRTRPDFREKLLDNFFTPDQARIIQTTLQAIKPDLLETDEIGTHGRFVVHDHPALIDLHAAVTPYVSELAGEEVEPSYTFLALYNRNGKCDVHLDAPLSKWTLDYCIEQSEPWPVAFSEVIPWPEAFDQGGGDWEASIKRSRDHSFKSYAMNPGQAILFSGSGQWHYREPFTNPVARSHCSLLFLHFTPVGTRNLSQWECWEAHFGIEGLTAAIR